MTVEVLSSQARDFETYALSEMMSVLSSRVRDAIRIYEGARNGSYRKKVRAILLDVRAGTELLRAEIDAGLDIDFESRGKC